MITEIKRKPEQDVIDQLEFALERAKSGELIGFAMTGELVGGHIYSVSSFKDGILLLGHLARQSALINQAYFTE